MLLEGNPQQGAGQLLEADMVYVGDFTGVENMNAEQWKHLALIAHHCYDSIDLALRAIMAATRLGAAGCAGALVKILASLGTPARATALTERMKG